MGDIVYKVVHRNARNVLASCSAFGQAEIKYPVGIFIQTRPWLARAGYHITVFNTFGCALSFLRIYGQNFEVWVAEAEEEARLPIMLSVSDLGQGCLVYSTGDVWPKGTRMYKRVKLLRKVWP